jgi:tRNA/rRNA methyltransferase
MASLALAARVRFVLVAPSHPGNIGAAARALKTMGWTRLAVVAPKESGFRDHEAAVAFATHGIDVLRAAESHATLAEALQGVQIAYAMTGYAREFGPRLVDLRAAAEEARAALAAGGRIAFVFGAERDGLRNDDVERCNACCAIPADAEHGSLNLAQAVQVAAYECRLTLARAAAARSPFAAEPPAAVDAVEALHAHWERALTAIGFLDAARPKRLMSRLRRFVNRARPTASEVDILRGVAASMIEPKRERAAGKGGAAADRLSRR